MGASKTYRQGQIRQIIRRQKIMNQEELRLELKKAERPLDVSQETISRDFKEMRLAHTVNGWMETPSMEGEPLFAKMASEFLESVRVAQNLIVLRTGPGHANTVAVALDDENWEEIVGTVAGDDTILVIAEDRDHALQLQQRFLEYVHPRSEP